MFAVFKEKPVELEITSELALPLPTTKKVWFIFITYKKIKDVGMACQKVCKPGRDDA